MPKSKPYVGRHRLIRPTRHRQIIDHVLATRPCVKTRAALVGFVILLAVVTANFGNARVVAADPPYVQQVAVVSADTSVPVLCPVLR